MLTKKQRDLLLYINERMRTGEIAPSFDEMKDALDLKSKSGIHRLISGLVERGYLERLPNRARALQVIKLPDMGDTYPPETVETPISMPDMALIVQVPMLGKIAAGTPIEAIRSEEDQLDLPANMVGSGEHYALKIEGDSMIKAGIHNGDTVVIKRCDVVNNGEIAVALVDDAEVTLKRYYKEQEMIILRPENDDYQDQELSAERVQVQGKLVSLVRNY